MTSFDDNLGTIDLDPPSKFPTSLVVALIAVIGILALIIGDVRNQNAQLASQPAHPRVIVENLVPNLEEAAPLWQHEIERRFDNAVGILVHGGDFDAGHWIVGTSYQQWKHVLPIETVIRHYQELYPDRTIVMICCNTGHVRLHGFPNVFIADSSVWVIPDRACTPEIMAEGKDRMKIPSVADLIAGMNVNLHPGLEFLPIVSHSRLDNDFEGAPTQTRWEQDPDVVGSIFEFHEAI